MSAIVRAIVFSFLAFLPVLAFPLDDGDGQAAPAPRPRRVIERRVTETLVVSLPYKTIMGTTQVDGQSTLRVWKGIQFASVTSRFERAATPTTDTATTSMAVSDVQRCAYGARADGNPTLVYDSCGDLSQQKTLTDPACASKLALYPAKEDCLSLTVFSPPKATALPVLVYIHGGGYSGGSARAPLAPLINANDQGFVGVSVEYRLGGWGFLSGNTTLEKGVVNAGLYDQWDALNWVHEHIHLFGGDPTRVTIGGESAGAGSVMLLNMAFGGSSGTKLFKNTIADSTYLPVQYDATSINANRNFDELSAQVGCDSPSDGRTTWECLQTRDRSVMQVAISRAATTARFAVQAYLPTTDGVFLKGQPSVWLAPGGGDLNGVRMLAGHMAHEATDRFCCGLPISPDNASAFDEYVSSVYPGLTPLDRIRLDNLYNIPAGVKFSELPRFDTTGVASSPNAKWMSQYAVGQLERAYNLYSESTFVCPSYWLTQAHARTTGHKAWKYQFSVPPVRHGGDQGYLGFLPPDKTVSTDIKVALMRIWGNFIRFDNPAISNFVANGVSTPNMRPNPAAPFPPYDETAQRFLNINVTGGVRVRTGSQGLSYYRNAKNALRIENARTWEDGRGYRCDFWRDVGPRVPY